MLSHERVKRVEVAAYQVWLAALAMYQQQVIQREALAEWVG
jgi:hypothetical protein